MRIFLALCLVAVVSAQSGYNYQPVATAPQLTQGYIPPVETSPVQTVAAPIAQTYAEPIVEQQPQQTYQQPAEVEKEFFTFHANDNDFQLPHNTDQLANSLRRALRVIFIKGPENHGLEDAAVSLAKHSAQQDTAIYVLNKQADIGDLANRLNAVRGNNNNRPEVHFVKYRTPEDAAHAQHAIQAQYDHLGGSTSYQDGGVAPALNFASNAPVRQVAAPSIPENSYLPASVFRQRA